MGRFPDQREVLFDRSRERDVEFASVRDREAREREQQLQYRDQIVAAQQRFGHNTPPVTQQRYAPPERSSATPLGRLGFPPPESQPHLTLDQRQYEYQQELQRRDYERERQRQERIEAEALHRQQIQAKRAFEEGLRRRAVDSRGGPGDRFSMQR